VITQPHHQGTLRRAAGTRPGRLAAALAALTCGLLAWMAVVPAATVRVVAAGGMAGWQIALIAVGAALIAAAAAVLLDRTLTGRRGAPAPTA